MILAILANKEYRRIFKWMKYHKLFDGSVKRYIKVMKLYHVHVRRTRHDFEGTYLSD